MAEIKRSKGLASRRGYAMLLTAGDEEISTALADGIMAARLPEAKPLTHEESQVVSAEIDRQKIADLLRVAMHPEPVDYAGKMFDAEMEYGESLYLPGPMRKVGEFLLVRYALVVLAFDRLFKALGM